MGKMLEEFNVAMSEIFETEVSTLQERVDNFRRLEKAGRGTAEIRRGGIEIIQQ
jgi:hypothetical protein